MKKFKVSNDKTVIFIILFISLVFSGFFISFQNLSIFSIDWLTTSTDKLNAHNGWVFYKKDLWRFPIGQNPNYGLDVSNSIVFSDSIPLFAVFFKFISFFYKNNFQYFSIWTISTVYLQFYFSYLLLNFFLKNKISSLLSSFLLILLPFFLFRLDHHPSLSAHWLIIAFIYVNYAINENRKKEKFYLLILLSSLIHLYFTAMLLIMYFIFLSKKVFFKKNIYIFLTELLPILVLLFFLMFIVGYFESNPVNAISRGYGQFNSDILSILDPAFDDSPSWSIIFHDLWPSTLEGFNYIGLGNIILLGLFSIIFFKNKNKIYTTLYKNYEIILITIIFCLWSFTSNLSIAGYNIISIPITNKYIYGLLSIFAATGRFLWPVIYILIFFSLIVLYKYLKNSYTNLIILALIFIQIFDMYPILHSKYNSNKNIQNKTEKFDDIIWNDISNNFKKLRTTYLFNNYGPIFAKISYFLSNSNINSTDIVLNASMSRSKAAKSRYELNMNLNNRYIPEDTVYIIDNIGHLAHLKYLFNKKEVGFFNRNNLWIMIPNYKKFMTQQDKIALNNVSFNQIYLNTKYQLNFDRKDQFLGLGWTHNFDNIGVWSEGPISSLMFDLSQLPLKNYKFEINFEKFKYNKNKDFTMEIFINDKLKEKIYLSQINDTKNLILKLNKNELKKNTIISFKFEGLTSSFEQLINPDARKLGILIKNFSIY